MAENILEAIDALLGQPFCSTDRSLAQELEKWQQELAGLRARLLAGSEASERQVIEESCRQVMAQVESRLAAANTNLFRVSPQVEYATFELATTLTALTASNTLATVKENINHLLGAILQDVQRELHRIFTEERSITLNIIKTEISQLFRSISEDYNDREVLAWIDQELAKSSPASFIDLVASLPEQEQNLFATFSEEELSIRDLTEASLPEQEQNLFATFSEEELSIRDLAEASLPEEEQNLFANFSEEELSIRDLTEAGLPEQEQNLFANFSEEELSSPDFPGVVEAQTESSASLALMNNEELADLDRLLDDLFQIESSAIDSLSFSPTDSITTIDVETIEDKLNEFADRLEISFTIPGAKKPPVRPSLPPLSLEDINDSWFLGIDFGNTHFRLSLSNLTTGQVYDLGEMKAEVIVNDRVLRSYKPLLQLGLPYYSHNQWRPIVQWSEDEVIPLVSLLNSIKQLLLNYGRLAVHPELSSVPLILQHLSGVVFGYPEQWDDAYIFNLRELILNCGFCKRPEQVIAVPQIMSPLLDRLHNVGPITEVSLFIDSGVNTTELLLVKPFEGKPLTNENLFYQSIDQGGEHLSMTLIQELLLPQLSFPQTPASLITLAETIKVHIDREDIWLDQDHKLSIGRSAYINRVCQPFLQLLNRHVNGLLIRSGLFAENVKVVVRSGGTMQGNVFQEWLAQKFPQAHRQEAPSNGNGLAVAPRFYGLLDLSHQQYSDFFLIHEICKLNWQEPMHPSAVLQQLQQRGINVHSCVNRVISILQNNLPKGVIPQDPKLVPDGAIEAFLESGGLFERLTNGFYQISPKQLAWMDNYLAQLCNHMQQSITEPLVFAPQTFRLRAATTK